MVVYLSEYIHPTAMSLLKERAEVVDNWDRIDEIEAAIIRTAPVTAETISKAKNLKVIGKHGVGFNTIDVEAAKAHHVRVLFTPTANTNSVAELIVGLILNICRNISYCDQVSSSDGFSRIAPPEVSGVELTGKTVGLVGMGNIARRAGEILKNGFSAKLIGYDPYCSHEQAEAFGIKKYDELNDMLEEADIVNISVPLTPSTENMISAENFRHFRKSAVLINAARGGIVNENDLYDALTGGMIRAAACDAFVQEPPTGENKLTTLKNFCATPHIGANTEDALYRMGMEVVEEILNVLDGKEPKHPVV